MRTPSLPVLALLAVGLVADPAHAQDAPQPHRFTALVLDPDGAPIEGAGVALGREFELTTDDALDRPLARSDRDGRVQFAVPADGGTAHLLLIAAPGRIAQVAELPRHTGVTAPLELGPVWLFPGIDLHGRVRDTRGQPLAGVWVEARRLATTVGQFASLMATRTRTGRDGIFRLRGAPPVARVTFGKDGFAQEIVVPVRADTPLSPVLREQGWVRGRIEGNRPEALQVFVRCEGATQQGEPTLVAADGSFCAPRNGDGRCRVVAPAQPGWDAGQSDVFEAVPENVVLSVAPSVRAPQVRLEVTAGGEPLPSFRVCRDSKVLVSGGLTISELMETFPSPGADAPGWVLGRDGVVDVDGVAGAAAVFLVAAEGHAAARVEVARDATRAVCELAPGCAISGRVLDPQQNPIEGAFVFAVRAREFVAFRRPRNAVRTDADGRYRIAGLPVGAWFVQVDAEGWQAPEVLRHDFAPGTAPDEVTGADVVVQPQRPLRGRVLGGARGGSVARWNVHQSPTTAQYLGPVGGRSCAALSRDGRFALTLEGGTDRAQLLLDLPPAAWHTSRTVLPLGPLGPEDPPLEVDLGAALLRMAGRVHVSGTAGRPQLCVVASPRGGPAMMLPYPTAGCDDGGAFELWLPKGTWQLYVCDLATGVVVGTADQPTEKGPVEIAVRLQRVEFRLAQPKVGPRLRVSHLRFSGDAGRERRAFPEVMTVPVPPGRDRVEVDLPLGKLTVRAENGFGELAAEVVEVTDDGPASFDLPLEVPASMKE